MAKCGHPHAETVLTRAGWKCTKCNKVLGKEIKLVHVSEGFDFDPDDLDKAPDLVTQRSPLDFELGEK